MIDPNQLVLRCKNGHLNRYNISGPATVSCLEVNCSESINSSRVERGVHPHIFWSISNQDIFPIAYAIPLTSKDTFAGLPTTYPVPATKSTGLKNLSYALVNQFVTIDIECFKNTNGDWHERLGGLPKDDINALAEIIKFCFDLAENPIDDWFVKNTDPKIITDLILSKFDQSQQEQIIDGLLDGLE
jgi:mRNA interferase MazF